MDKCKSILKCKYISGIQVCANQYFLRDEKIDETAKEPQKREQFTIGSSMNVPLAL